MELQHVTWLYSVPMSVWVQDTYILCVCACVFGVLWKCNSNVTWFHLVYPVCLCMCICMPSNFKNNKRERERELTSLRTKTWFRTHMGSISFKTEHRLVSLCIAASNLQLPKDKDTNHFATYERTSDLHFDVSWMKRKTIGDLHFDRTIIFRMALMARQRKANCCLWRLSRRHWNSWCIIHIRSCLLWKKLRLTWHQ